MHKNSLKLMAEFVATLPPPPLRVIDIGALNVNGNYRDLFANYEYVGADIVEGPNVDVVLHGPYDWRAGTDWDVAISGQCVEHVPDLAAWAREFGALLKPGGLACILVPWVWGEHRFPVDCWRVLPDGMAWLIETAGLVAIETRKDGHDCVGLARKEAP